MGTGQSAAVGLRGKPLQQLEFTGERIVPGKTEEALFREHEERYVFAGQYVAGKDVLDVACGTGVGSSFLHRAGARSVWGLDIHAGAVAYAKARYPDCEFAESDAANLCLPDRSVDVVVSFETLEHLADQGKFLTECWRVLRPRGVLICSTPNRAIYRWQRANPFHVHEFTLSEFEDFVSTHFGDLCLFSQAERIYPVYVLRRLVSRSLDYLGWKRTIKNALGWRVLPEMREEFSRDNGSALRDVRPYRRSWFRQPTYVIAVAARGKNG